MLGAKDDYQASCMQRSIHSPSRIFRKARWKLRYGLMWRGRDGLGGWGKYHGGW